jgi:L-threonylcarbamoyladenylate synthase
MEELGEWLSEKDLALDGGPSAVGLESTIIDCTGNLPSILRPGAITIAMIQETTNLEVLKVSDGARNIANEPRVRVSGSLESHYSPKARVLIDQQPVAGCGFIAIADIETPSGVVRLAAPKSIEQYAQVLYEALRNGDHQSLEAIYVIQPVGDGLAIAIRDRLRRAANLV